MCKPRKTRSRNTIVRSPQECSAGTGSLRYTWLTTLNYEMPTKKLNFPARAEQARSGGCIGMTVHVTRELCFTSQEVELLAFRNSQLTKNNCPYMKKYIFVVLFFLFAFSLTAYCFLPSPVHAYTETSEGPEILVTLSPANPGANQSVTASLQSFSLDLERAAISWYLDDARKDSGPAHKTFTFHTGQTGKEMRLAVHVDTQEGLTADKVLVINPANVDLMWEAATYVPPLYRGKSLPTPGSLVRVVALPSFVGNDGGRLRSENLIYDWERDFSKVFAASGRGKNIFVFTMPDGFASVDIGLRVSDESGGLVAENKLSLTPIAPSIRFYEEHPLEGTRYAHALTKSFDLRASEFTLRAEPFGMFASGAPLDYLWQVDGTAATPHTEAKNLLTLRQNKGSSGSSSLSLTITNLTKSLSAAVELMINFGK